jgi:hypothetical protein
MVDIQTISIAIASAGVFGAAVYYVLQMRHQAKARQTDLIIRLYSLVGSKEFSELLRKSILEKSRAPTTTLKSTAPSQR